MKTKSSFLPESTPRGAQSGRRSRMSGLRTRLRRFWAKIIDTFFWKAGEIQPSFLATIDLNDYILATDCKLWVQNSPFHGLVYRGVFLRSIFFHEGLLVLVWLLWQFRLIADARFANANCDFFVNFQKHCYVLAFFVGYLLRASFFKTTFNFRHRHCCKVSPSIGYPMDRRYFNQEATSAIFSKNFLTNFFFGLLFGLSRCLPIRGTIFRKP